MSSQPKLMLALETVRSAFNVGSVFRSCDAAGIDKLFLCGYCAIPPHDKLVKTALGSHLTVPWEHHCSALLLVRWLQSQKVRIVVVENDVMASSVFDSTIKQDTCLVFGHEEAGVTQELINLADEIVTIPQLGKKDSLNISVAAGVTMYEYARKLNRF